jgi:hypothetical protein
VRTLCLCPKHGAPNFNPTTDRFFVRLAPPSDLDHDVTAKALPNRPPSLDKAIVLRYSVWPTNPYPWLSPASSTSSASSTSNASAGLGSQVVATMGDVADASMANRSTAPEDVICATADSASLPASIGHPFDIWRPNFRGTDRRVAVKSASSLGRRKSHAIGGRVDGEESDDEPEPIDSTLSAGPSKRAKKIELDADHAVGTGTVYPWTMAYYEEDPDVTVPLPSVASLIPTFLSASEQLDRQRAWVVPTLADGTSPVLSAAPIALVSSSEWLEDALERCCDICGRYVMVCDQRSDVTFCGDLLKECIACETRVWVAHSICFQCEPVIYTRRLSWLV